MSLVPFAFVVPAMVIIAIVVFSFFGSHYQQYYDNYHTVHFPIMLALSVIPILGVTGYFVSDPLFKVISVFCCLVSVIFVLGLFASMLGFVFGIVDVVAGALALVVTLLIVGALSKVCTLLPFFAISSSISRCSVLAGCYSNSLKKVFILVIDDYS